MNKSQFYKEIRASLFSGKITESQLEGIEVILDEIQANCITDLRFTSYALATAYHETGKLMQPVREGFAKNDAQAIAAVTKLYATGKISKNYALPEKNGKSYYGRGIVQLTWGWNYKNMGNVLGLDLYSDPDLALNKKVSANILIKGLKSGLFTGKRFADFCTDKNTDWIGCRKCINGTDQAVQIAVYANKFYSALILT